MNITHDCLSKSYNEDMVQVGVINKSENSLPMYETKGAAGLDVRADLKSPIVVEVGKNAIIPTGLFLDIPDGYEVQVRPRSGLAAKHCITVLNAPGTIDADYKGEVKVILINHGREDFYVNPAERIAQLVIAKVERLLWREVGVLSTSERGVNGLGHTGL